MPELTFLFFVLLPLRIDGVIGGSWGFTFLPLYLSLLVIVIVTVGATWKHATVQYRCC